MQTEKYKIWDVQNAKWFTPEYPGMKMDHKKGKPYQSTKTDEILFSQSGEMFRHIDGNMFHLSSDEEAAQYIPCVYTGLKDDHDTKAYLNDLVRSDDMDGVIVFEAGCFMIYDEISKLSIPLGLTKDRRRRSFTITGNLLEYKSQLEKAAGNNS